MEKSNERVITALNRAIKNKPDIEIGKFLRYTTSVDDLAYMTDEDIALLLESYNEMAEKYNYNSRRNYEFKATDINYIDDNFIDENDSKRMFTKENEQIAYDRYKPKVEGHIFFELEERLDCSEFLKRFTIEFIDPEDYKGITLINHRNNFLDIFPNAYRHMNAYAVGRKGDKYVAMHKYAAKIPCFGELFEIITYGFSKNFDECFSIAIDWMESPRFTDYTNHIMYGVCTRPEKKEIEVYDTDQTIEIFHDLMQKSNKVISNWDGVLYDDGTVDFI